MFISKYRILGYLRAGLRSPSLGLLILGRDEQAVIRTQIRKLTHFSEQAVHQAFEEFPRDDPFLQYLGTMQKELWISCAGGPTLYVLGRLVRPLTVVETGVADGVSSAYILKALADNSRGHLYSIDLGKSGHLAAGRETGWIVPEQLRDRWTLLFGDAKDVLPELLDDLGSFEMFLHDSDHSYDHMMWEFSVAWRILAAGGLLLSDDIWLNATFFDFAKRTRSTPVPLFSTRSLGGLKKAEMGPKRSGSRRLVPVRGHRPRPDGSSRS